MLWLSQLVRAVRSLAKVGERLVALLERATEPPMAERSEVGLRLRITDEPTEGAQPMSLALAINNRQFAELAILASLVDQDGAPIKKAVDGVYTPITQDEVLLDWSVSDENVAKLNFLSPDKKTLEIHSGVPGDPNAVGSARIRGAFTYPDGSVKEYIIDLSVGNSGAGEPAVTVVVKNEDGTPVVPPTPTPNP